MRWRKLGQVFAPSRDRWWATHGYALAPTVDVQDDRLRIYFASLDDAKYGRVGHVDVNAKDPTRAVDVSLEPDLDLGPLGAFDDSGVTPSCVLRVGDQTWMYYIGWQRCERVPYMLFSGLARRIEPAGRFERRSHVPVLDRTPFEPFSRSAPCVLEDGPRFRAWYWSCEHWSNESNWVHYNTSIRHADSPDGIRWADRGHECFRAEGSDYAVGRPWVMKTAAGYQMWYSIRSRGTVGYRIGYAESADGLVWRRRDEDAGIAPSTHGWDAEMICHPCVVDTTGGRYLFYNGNAHGRDGFGCAILEQD